MRPLSSRHSCRILNQAKILINLCPQPNPIVELFQWVYELHDETHSSKLLQSQQRYDWYRQKGFSLGIV